MKEDNSKCCRKCYQSFDAKQGTWDTPTCGNISCSCHKQEEEGSFEERFDKKFSAVKETDTHFYNPWLSDVKSFFRTELQMIVGEVEKSLEGIYRADPLELREIKNQVLEALTKRMK